MRFNAGEVITAMITPFKEDLSVDYVALEKLVNHLIENGTDTILVAGTTGETPTLSHEEEREIFLFVKKVVNGRVKIVLGAGSNSTATAIESSIKAKELGATNTHFINANGLHDENHYTTAYDLSLIAIKAI